MRAAVALALLLAACGQADAPPKRNGAAPAAATAESALPPASALQGTWDLIGYDPPVPTADGGVIRVTIGPTSLDAISGCMPFHWLYGVMDGRLVLSRQAHDELVCDRPPIFPEQAFSALMQTAERMSVDGDRLTIRSPHGRIVLRRATPSPSPRA